MRPVGGVKSPPGCVWTGGGMCSGGMKHTMRTRADYPEQVMHVLNRGLPERNIESDYCQPSSLWLGVCWDWQPPSLRGRARRYPGFCNPKSTAANKPVRLLPIPFPPSSWPGNPTNNKAPALGHNTIVTTHGGLLRRFVHLGTYSIPPTLRAFR